MFFVKKKYFLKLFFKNNLIVMEFIDGIVVIYEFIMYFVCICVENVDILKFIFIF